MMKPEQTDQEQEEQRPEPQLGLPEKKDRSLDLVYGLLFDLKESFGRIDERTQALQHSVDTLHNDIKGMANTRTVWTVGGIILGVVLGMGALIYQAVQMHSHMSP